MGLFRRSVDPILPNGDYLSVAMPTTGVHALQVLTRQGPALRRFSRLDTVLVAPKDASLPGVVTNTVADAQGTAKRSTKAGVGLSIVGSFVKALGGKGLSPKLSAERAESVVFAFTDLTEETVDLAELDKWLALADFDPGSHAVADLLAAEELYVVVGVLRAAGITLSLLDEAKRELAVEVPAVAQAVGGDVDVSASDSSNTTISFTGRTPLAVGAKAAQLRFGDSGFWVSEDPVQKGEIRGFGARSGATYLTGVGSLAFAD